MKFGGPIDMLHGSLWDKVLAFTLPLVATALLQQLYNGADLTVLGQFVGKQAMAAVGNDIPVVGLFLSLLLGLSLGGNVVVAQLLGGGKYKEASKAVHTAFALSLIIGILLLVVGQVFAVPA
ncbi:MAG: MATE family efflux transporter, partial [Megasphaera micronuciformis]|nr:MATE family efflux transporter [Megasphaera micronuciformis]